MATKETYNRLNEVKTILLGVNDAKTRAHAILRLRYHGTKDIAAEALQIVKIALNDKELQVKIAAIQTLSSIYTYDSVGTLLEILENSNSKKIKRAAGLALLDLGEFGNLLK